VPDLPSYYGFFQANDNNEKAIEMPMKQRKVSNGGMGPAMSKTITINAIANNKNTTAKYFMVSFR
jgi:hypothetical protein